MTLIGRGLEDIALPRRMTLKSIVESATSLESMELIVLLSSLIFEARSGNEGSGIPYAILFCIFKRTPHVYISSVKTRFAGTETNPYTYI